MNEHPLCFLRSTVSLLINNKCPHVGYRAHTKACHSSASVCALSETATHFIRSVFESLPLWQGCDGDIGSLSCLWGKTYPSDLFTNFVYVHVCLITLDRVSRNPGWLWTFYIGESNFEFQFLLPPPLRFWPHGPETPHLPDFSTFSCVNVNVLELIFHSFFFWILSYCFSVVCATVWVRNVAHRLRYLNTWSQTGYLIFGEVSAVQRYWRKCVTRGGLWEFKSQGTSCSFSLVCVCSSRQVLWASTSLCHAHCLLPPHTVGILWFSSWQARTI